MPTKKVAMLDLDWLGRPLLILTIASEETRVCAPWSTTRSRSRAPSADTTHEAGRHFFRVYGVLTRRLIFSPEEFSRLPVRRSSSEKEARERGGHRRRVRSQDVREGAGNRKRKSQEETEVTGGGGCSMRGRKYQEEQVTRDQRSGEEEETFGGQWRRRSQ